MATLLQIKLRRHFKHQRSKGDYHFSNSKRCFGKGTQRTNLAKSLERYFYAPCNVQGHPTNLFLSLSVPQRNLAGWQKYRCFDELVGNFVIHRGFAWELLTFSSISTRAGCRNSDDWGRLKKKKKKKNPFPLLENCHKHTTAAGSEWLRLRKKPVLSGFVAFVRSFWIEGFESARNSWLGNKFDQLAGKPTNFI